MIIRIEDLPNGQAIRHINVDITFDDAGSPTTTVISEHGVSNVSDVSDVSNDSDKSNTQPVFTQYNLPISAHASQISDVERPKKEIPDEMKDLEF